MLAVPYVTSFGIIALNHVSTKPGATQPAVSQVQMHFLAQPALGPYGEAVTDDQHPDHQLRIDRGAAGVAIERREVLP